MGYPTLWNTCCRALALDAAFGRWKLFGGQLLTFWNHGDTRTVDVINGCFWMTRRSALDQVGLLDERFFMYGEDIDWCRRFNDHGWKVVFFHEALALHYGGASSANAPVKYYLAMQHANYQYWRKHRPAAVATTFLCINLLHHAIRVASGILAYPFARHNGPDWRHKMTRSVAAIKWAISALAISRSSHDLETTRRPL
jgi:GT2 family glycosyltransferase